MRAIILVLVVSSVGLCTNRSWTGLGANANWTTVANWNPNGAPVSGDVLTFNNTCTNCNSTVDANITVDQLTFAATYTGTTTGGAHSITINGGFNGNFAHLGGTLAFTGTSVIVTGGGSHTFSCTGNFNSLTGGTVQLGGSSTQNIISGCTVALSGGVILDYSSTLNVQSTASLTLLAGTQLDSLTNAGTVTVAAGTFMPGSITNTGTMSLTGVTVNLGTNGGNKVLACSGNFNSTTGATAVNFSAGATLTVQSGCTVTFGTVNNGSATLNVASGATVNIPSTVLVSSITNSGTLTQTASGTLSVNSISNSGTMTLTNVALSYSNGGNENMTCTGNFNTQTGVASVTFSDAGTFHLNTGCAVTLAAMANNSTTIFVHTGATLTLPNSGNISTMNNQGTMNGGTGAISLSGNWSSTGTFNPGTSTISFDDSNNHSLTGATTFYNLTFSTVNSRTLTFPASTTQTVNGRLTLNGNGSGKLSLRSSATPTQWTIVKAGTQTIDFVDVKDSVASGATIYAGVNSTNSLNNVNWVFTAPPVIVPRKHVSIIQ